MKLRHVPTFLRQALRCPRSEQWCVMSFHDVHGGRAVITYYRSNARYNSFVTAAQCVAVLEEARYILDGGGGGDGEEAHA